MAERGVLYTVGYGQRTIQEFVGLLQEYQIRYLIDVRSVPYSRFRPEFSKAALQQHMERASIRYVFMGELLGGRPRGREYYTCDGKVSYDLLRASDDFRLGLERLRKASALPHRVTVMCAEAKPERCHRGKLLAPALMDSYTDVMVIHLDELGAELTDAALQYRMNGGQMELFALGKPDGSQ